MDELHNMSIPCEYWEGETKQFFRYNTDLGTETYLYFYEMAIVLSSVDEMPIAETRKADPPPPSVTATVASSDASSYILII